MHQGPGRGKGFLEGTVGAAGWILRTKRSHLNVSNKGKTRSDLCFSETVDWKDGKMESTFVNILQRGR